jgi:hypothetical protein
MVAPGCIELKNVPVERDKYPPWNIHRGKDDNFNLLIDNGHLFVLDSSRQ